MPTSTVPKRDRRPQGAWLGGAWAAGLAILATWATFSDLAFFQSADSLIPILAGTQHWTPFFWGQDRYGMALPLLAWPWRDPADHFVLQLILRSWVVLAAPFVIARYLAGRGRWLLVGSLACSLAIYRFHVGGLSFYGYHSYLQALLAMLGGSLAWEAGALAQDWRRLMWRLPAVVAFAVGCWITPSVVFWALPLILLRAWRQALRMGHSSQTPAPKRRRPGSASSRLFCWNGPDPFCRSSR